MSNNIPIPDPWRLNYPHFLGSPTRLRIFYVFVIIVTLVSFSISYYYYYQFDEETTVVIAFSLKSGDEWDCTSIGTYNGEYQFNNQSTLPFNLEESPSMTRMSSIYYIPHEIQTSSNTSTSITAFYINDGFDVRIFTETYEITWGNAPTTEICIKTMQEYSCANIHHPETIIEDIHVYKLTLNFDVHYASEMVSTFNTTQYNFTTSYVISDIIDVYTIGLYGANDTDPSYIFSAYKEGLYSFSGFDVDEIEFWLISNKTEENLCGVISDGIDNGVTAWGFYVIEPINSSYSRYTGLLYRDFDTNCDWYCANLTCDDSWYCYDSNCDVPNICADVFSWNDIRSFDIQWECELISDDYCMVNASDQFTYTDDNSLPSKTKMKSEANDWDSQLLILGPDLGSDCGERWENVCLEYYDIEGYCERVYSPPYSCTKVEKKGALTILSLSFATSQLVYTALIVFISLMFKAFAVPVHGESNDEDGLRDSLLEMHKGTIQRGGNKLA